MFSVCFSTATDLIRTIYATMKDIPRDIRRNYAVIVSKNLYDTVKHVLFINRIIGLFPLAVSKSGNDFKLEWSWSKVVFNNFFVASFAVLTVAGLSFSYAINEVYDIRLKGLAALMSTSAEIISLSSTWFVGQISISLLFKEFWKYLLLLVKFDDVIGQSDPSNKIPILITTVFAFTFTCLAMDIYMWSQIVVPLIGPFHFLWQMVPFYFTYVFTMILEINLWIFVRCLSIRLDKLNKLLLSYDDLAEEFRFGNSVALYGKKKIVGQCNLVTSNMLKHFLVAYGRIGRANQALNKLFGPAMIMLLLNIISCLVITPYVLYQEILNAKKNDFLFTQLYWMICHVLRLLLLIEPCHFAKIQGREIRKTVTKMLERDLEREAYKQVKKFLLLLSENRIEFDAAGTTLISRTLLPTIGSAVFTYLAILFQYKNNT